MMALKTINVAVVIPVAYETGRWKRLVAGEWVPVDARGEMDRAHDAAKEWIDQHLPRLEARRAGIEIEPEYVCSHCRGAWTEDDSSFNGGCCDKDMENAPPETTEAA